MKIRAIILSALILCGISAVIMYSRAAQPLARLAIAYPSDFQFGACRLIALAANERGIPGCVRGSDGLLDLPDRYGGRRDYG